MSYHSNLKIGVDLDNTIATFDELILKICTDLHIDVPICCRTKASISRYLKDSGKNKEWTDIQAAIYGPKMHEAKVAAGFPKFVETAIAKNCTLTLISNRSFYAAHDFDKKYNLHESAKNWINTHLPNIFNHTHFEPSASEKIRIASELKFDFFIDDLDEMVSSIDVRYACIKVDYEQSDYGHAQMTDAKSGLNWFDITKIIFGS